MQLVVSAEVSPWNCELFHPAPPEALLTTGFSYDAQHLLPRPAGFCLQTPWFFKKSWASAPWLGQHWPGQTAFQPHQGWVLSTHTQIFRENLGLYTPLDELSLNGGAQSTFERIPKSGGPQSVYPQTKGARMMITLTMSLSPSVQGPLATQVCFTYQCDLTEK